MGRVYSVSFSAVAVTQAQDLFEIIAASGKPITIKEIIIGQYSDFADAAAEILPILIKRATGAYTTGSGGTTPTPAKYKTIDAAAGATAKANNTTQAVAGEGALTVLRADKMNIADGYRFVPSDPLMIAPGNAVIVSSGAPADSLTMNATIVFEED